MNKCKGCQWYGKPYWSIINPCDNCPRENTNIEIITRWQDPYIEELQKRINKAIEYIKTHSNCGGVVQEGKFIIEHIEEIYDGMKLIDILRGEDNE